MSVLDVYRMVVGTCQMAGRHAAKNTLLDIHRVVVSSDHGPGIPNVVSADCGMPDSSGYWRSSDLLVVPVNGALERDRGNIKIPGKCYFFKSTNEKSNRFSLLPFLSCTLIGFEVSTHF
ncbi:MAG: hypothetical protein HFG63_05275 [Lachnospiraceae bacterium]|nr:hypothetical protein [Lachnospiraceae bacterium]